MIRLKVENINFYDEANAVVLMSIFHLFFENQVALRYILERKFQKTFTNV
jgi:hypothetical protein